MPDCIGFELITFNPTVKTNNRGPIPSEKGFFFFKGKARRLIIGSAMGILFILFNGHG